MLGELLGDAQGRRIVRRVISVDPPTAEVSFEDSGQVLGIPATGIGTYTSVVRPDGALYGTGQGLTTTNEGDAVTWTATGLGKFGTGGSISYRGMLFFRSASPKLARMNNACAAFEYEVAPDGTTVSKYWEWK